MTMIFLRRRTDSFLTTGFLPHRRTRLLRTGFLRRRRNSFLTTGFLPDRTEHFLRTGFPLKQTNVMTATGRNFPQAETTSGTPRRSVNPNPRTASEKPGILTQTPPTTRRKTRTTRPPRKKAPTGKNRLREVHPACSRQSPTRLRNSADGCRASVRRYMFRPSRSIIPSRTASAI